VIKAPPPAAATALEFTEAELRDALRAKHQSPESVTDRPVSGALYRRWSRDPPNLLRRGLKLGGIVRKPAAN